MFNKTKDELILYYYKSAFTIIVLIGICIFTFFIGYVKMTSTVSFILLLFLSFSTSLANHKILEKNIFKAYISLFITIVGTILFLINLVLLKNHLAFTDILEILVVISPLILLCINSVCIIKTSFELSILDKDKNIILSTISKIVFSLSAILFAIIATFAFLLMYSFPTSTSTVVIGHTTYIENEISYNWMHPNQLTTTYEKVIIPGLVIKPNVSPPGVVNTIPEY